MEGNNFYFCNCKFFSGNTMQIANFQPFLLLKKLRFWKRRLFNHFSSQHGNVLCLGSPVTVIRSWGFGHRTCFPIALNTLCMAPWFLSPRNCLCQTQLFWQHLADGGSEMQAVGVQGRSLVWLLSLSLGQGRFSPSNLLSGEANDHWRMQQ